MIQRIQSVWLLIATILAFLTLKFSFYSGTSLPDNLYHQLNGTDNILLMIVSIALSVLCLINIFLFKTRVMQLRLCIAALLLDVLVVFLYFKAIQHFSQGEFSIYAVSHIIIVAALVLAALAIDKDEKLVKDSDRLR